MTAEIEVRGLSRDQIELVKSQIAPRGTTDDELALFIGQCNRTGLDPFAKQIYLMERRSKVGNEWVTKRVPEVSIDGLRVVAQRSHEYQGQTEPLWFYDGAWSSMPPVAGLPEACKVGVWRKGFKEPLVRVATYEQSVQRTSQGEPNSVWKKMPAHMLLVSAERFALRAAFPHELSGLYTPDEMGDDVTEMVTVDGRTINPSTGELVATDPEGRTLVLGDGGSVEVVEGEVVAGGEPVPDPSDFDPEDSGAGPSGPLGEEPSPPSGSRPPDDDVQPVGSEATAALLRAAVAQAQARGLDWTEGSILQALSARGKAGEEPFDVGELPFLSFADLNEEQVKATLALIEEKMA